MDVEKLDLTQTMSYASKTTPIDVTFQDVSCSISLGKRGRKYLLKTVSGQFKSRQLTAILGPSGSGKTTLLNTLSGYKCKGRTTGSILINGEQKNPKEFRKISRYIMQQDLIQPMLSVEEAMMMAANLKLNRNMSKSDKIKTINEVLDLLRLSESKATMTNRISGGERRRLSIALELLNNPPVLFLDEPTTGLDDLSCSQCIALLKIIAQEGRTVICSIHTPSAKLFTIFDRVYVMSLGQCVYQGYGPDCISFLSDVGLECPTHYNPADFIVEVCSGEYGNYQNVLVQEIENGKRIFKEKVVPQVDRTTLTINAVVQENDFNKVRWFAQLWIILTGMWLQMYRDKSNLLMQFLLYLSMGLIMGFSYFGIGQDGSKTVINSRFIYACMVIFVYIPIMPVLVQFPTKIQILRKEYFNRWYHLSAYFCALSFCTIPLLFIFGLLFITLVYTLTDQPMEIDRFIMFATICLLTGIAAESFGQLVSAQLSLVNGMFVGPASLAPCLLLAAYGLGSGYETIPILIKIAMQFSFMRYSFEGMVYAILEKRDKLSCPEDREFCFYTDLDFFLKEMGLENSNFLLDVTALIFISAIFRGGSFYLLKQRLNPNKTFIAIRSIGTLVKSHLSSNR